MQKYYLGIDVSKGYADLLILNSNKKTIEECFQLDDTFDGHNRLYHFLHRFFAARPDSVLLAAVESTGGYENNWFHTLLKFQDSFNLKVARLNPSGVNYHSKACFNRVVTDKTAARSIAEYLIIHPENVSYQTDDKLTSLRGKWKFINSLTRQKSRFLTQLEKLLYVAHPEILLYCKDNVSQWLLKLLELCPTANTLANTPVEDIAAIPYISKSRAAELVANAKKSVASASDALTEDSIRTIAAEIRHLQQLINKQTALIEKENPLPEILLLKSFDAIGTNSAVGLLIEMGPVERFPTVKHLCSYWGLHPVFKTSGDSTSGIHMSKQGRKEARAILFMITMAAIVQNPLIRDVYYRNLKKGKSKLDAMGVCMHKIARIVYGMLKNKTPFNPDIDRRNQARAQQKKPKGKLNRNRRHQKLDRKAPVSKRQYKKRKEQEMSQDEAVSSNPRSIPCPDVAVQETIS